MFCDYDFFYQFTLGVEPELIFSAFFSLIVIFLPLMSFLLSLFSWTMPYKLMPYLSVFLIFLNALFSFLLWSTVVLGDFLLITESGLWIKNGLVLLNWVFCFDPLTVTMFVVVNTISSVVHFYSLEYMTSDPHLNRFMGYLSLFTFFMLLLVASNHLLGLFLGWEGVGLCSYLLIGFWFTRLQANKAALKAMIVNRIADLFLTLGIITTLFLYQTLNFNLLFGFGNFFSSHFFYFYRTPVPALALITFFLFLGAMGKSAQLGLHTWLPDAMEGPTPVSALIHAATLVTAGIFLILRCSTLFECTPQILLFIGFIGAATAFFAATSGLLQNDLKKVIAYSTCSQLGYMALTCALSQYNLSFFHLTNHAFFKALLFLSAGAVIHGAANEQDLRRYGALARLLPFTYIMIVIGSLSLMGMPFLTGFYSKDLILEVAAATTLPVGFYTWWFALITAFCTAFYSLRLVYLAFITKNNTPKALLTSIHELTGKMAGALISLVIGSLFIGYFLKDLFVGWGSPVWSGTLFTSLSHSQNIIASEFLPVCIKFAPFFTSLLALGFLIVCQFFSNIALVLPGYVEFYRFISYKWYFDVFYNYFINKPFLIIAYVYSFSFLDKGLLEIIGPLGFSSFLKMLGNSLSSVQSGYIWFYSFFIFFNLGFFFIFYSAVGF